MDKVRVQLVTLGNLKYPVDFKFIENWKSRIFQAHHIDEICVLPNTDNDDWSYSDKTISTLVTTDKNYNFTLGLINAPLENNYYVRWIEKTVIILSLHETAELLKESNLTIENFIIRNIYEFCSIYLETSKNNISIDAIYNIPHDETRGCLFDMCGNKADIVFSTEEPTICDQCKARISQSQLSKGFLSNLEKELSKIKKSLYYRLIDFIEKRPILAIVITALSAIFLNLLSNMLYDFIKVIIKSS